MNGWRLNGIEPSGKLAGFEHPPQWTTTTPAECKHAPTPGLEVYRAALLAHKLIGSDWATGAHQAPHPDCVCGFRVCKTLESIWFTDRFCSPETGPEYGLAGRSALIYCEGIGPGLPDPEMPYGDVSRHAKLRYKNLALIRKSASPELVGAFKSFYPITLKGMFETTTRGIEVDWFDSPVPAEFTKADQLSVYTRPFVLYQPVLSRGGYSGIPEA